MKKVFLMLLVLLSISFGDCYWEQMINHRDDGYEKIPKSNPIKIVYICLNNQLYVGSFVKNGDGLAKNKHTITGINPVWVNFGTSDGIRPKFCKCEK